MAVIAIYSMKGGVGKTTLAVNLAWCAATVSARQTLLWDLDAQAAASWLLDGDGTAGAPGKDHARAIFAKEVGTRAQIVPTRFQRLDLLRADASLRDLDKQFVELGKRKRLAKLVGDLVDAYDRIVLDCPPGLTETSDQAIRAADLIIVPVIPSALSQRALSAVTAHLARTHGRHAPLFPVHVMVDRRRALHQDALAKYPDWPVVPMASAFEAMTSRGPPVAAGRSAAARAVALLWTQIERRLAA